LGIARWQPYEYRGLAELQQSEIDSYEETCRAEHRVPTRSGLLNATRKRQMLQRNVRNRLYTEDRNGLFGSNLTEGDPSPASLAHETVRRFCEEDQLAHFGYLLPGMSPRAQGLMKWLIENPCFQRDFAQNIYERRDRPEEQRRFIAQLMAEDEAERNIPTNSSERDETTRHDHHRAKARRAGRQKIIRVDAVAIAADPNDVATIN
jgi:hypothetical protein